MRNLVVVVLVLLLVANSAFAESEAPAVKAKLDRVMKGMEPVKVAIEMYYMEQGTFPGKAEAVTPANTGKPIPPSSPWHALGFSVYPTLPPEVASLSYVPFNVQGDGASSFGLIVTLQNIKANAIDGQLIGFSPGNDMVITGPGNATGSGVAINGHTLQLSYACHQMTNQAVDPLLRNYFANAGTPMVCK